MRAAARIGATFGLDPLVVIGGGSARDRVDRFSWCVRVAAHNVVARETKGTRSSEGRPGVD